jgi:hypothetical protein
VESRLLGFPCFPYSVISMALLWKRVSQNNTHREGRFSNRNHLSEMATIRLVPNFPFADPTWRTLAPMYFASVSPDPSHAGVGILYEGSTIDRHIAASNGDRHEWPYGAFWLRMIIILTIAGPQARGDSYPYEKARGVNE